LGGGGEPRAAGAHTKISVRVAHLLARVQKKHSSSQNAIIGHALVCDVGVDLLWDATRA